MPHELAPLRLPALLPDRIRDRLRAAPGHPRELGEVPCRGC
ncbi:hypothetical protein QF035_004166 [Streptomyces umbrinus]|uniref:Uncharacterized protein n=1 Tax=Streptomyces umbrinus TaxID=67370 RepID=A0ABU0SSP4_9ACTN|nr:hypothetical protein [Streptomyces umbrinus]